MRVGAAFTVLGFVLCLWLALALPNRETRRLHRLSTPTTQPRVQTREDLPLVLDLLAVALSAGLPVGVALAHVGDCLSDWSGDPGMGSELSRVGRAAVLGAELEEAFASVGDSAHSAALAVIRGQLEICVRTGAAVAPVLRSSAVVHRRTARRRAEAQAARLGVRLVLPLGLCALPAFVALAVVPVVLSLAWGFLG